MNYQNYSNDTELGKFSNSLDFKKALIANGYENLGWKNEWRSDNWRVWNELVDDPTVLIKDYSWNNRGSDITFIIPSKKLFCSVDAGD